MSKSDYEGDEEQDTNSNTPSDSHSLMWGDMWTDKVPLAAPKDEAAIRLDCETELKLYLLDEGLPLMDEKRAYLNPLDWWKVETKYKILRELAQSILSITASSAPSERFWSRLANILSMKRARLKEDATSGIMFVKENLSLLRKHYKLLTQQNMDALPLEQTDFPLPEDISDIDAGQDLFDINVDF